MTDADEMALAALLVGARIEMPPEIQRTSASLALALPTATDIRRIFREEIELWIAQHDGREPAGDPEAAEALVQHLLCMYQDDALRLQTDVEKLGAVGGQARLKRWLDRRREGFVGDAASLYESHALKQELATDPVLAD